MRVVIDASAILSAFLPNEQGQKAAQALLEAHAKGPVRLLAPTLLPYELGNALIKAMRRGRLSMQQAQLVIERFEALRIALAPVDLKGALALAWQHDRSAYDAVYLALAETEGLPLITADRRLYNAVVSELSWVVQLEEWEARIALDEDQDPIE